MLEEYIMKIPLVEGWQYIKFNFYFYPFECKKRVIFDKKYNAFYKQNCIKYIDGVSFIQLPVFIVWYIMKGIKKRQIVVDFRIFN